MVQHVSKLEYEKSEFNKFDQAKYQIKIKTNKKGKIKQLHIIHRSYPLFSQGYDNYEEFNVKLTKLVKYTNIHIYFIRQDWNGTGYFPVCYTKMQVGDEFFNFVIANNSVRDAVVQLLKHLGELLEKSGEGNECFYSTYYFPV